MASFDYVAYQKSVSDRMVTAKEQAGVHGILKELQMVGDEAESLIAEDPGDRSLIDCAAGCKTCCVVNVSTLLPEGLAIARYLQTQGQETVQATRERLEALWGEVRGLDDEDRLFVRRSCAFLDEKGCCSIYPVRPLLCRSVTSTDAQNCRDALSGLVLGEETAVLMHQFQQNLYESLFTGVADGLEATGLDGRSFQLTGLLRYLLKHPQAETDWMDGKRLSWQDIF